MAIMWNNIISSIIGAAVLALISYIVKIFIIPLYRKFIYNGFQVNGLWEITWTDKTLRRNIQFRLNQTGTQVQGESTHILKNKKLEGDYQKYYTLKGEIKDGYLYLVCKNKKSDRLGLSVVLLKVVSDGQKMEGWISAYNSSTANVEGFKCTTKKIDK